MGLFSAKIAVLEWRAIALQAEQAENAPFLRKRYLTISMDNMSVCLIENINIDVLYSPTKLVCSKATAFERTAASKGFL